MRFLFFALFLVFSTARFSGQEKAVDFASFGKGETIKPNDKVCFDYKVTFKGVFKGKAQSGCFYINGVKGAVLSFGFNNAEMSGCNYNKKGLKFTAYLHSLKGDSYLYYNGVTKKPGSKTTEITHDVHTGNTDDSSAQDTFRHIKFVAKDEFREFADGRFKGRRYVSLDGKSEIYLLTSPDDPQQFESLSYLGSYGLGFLETSKGNFMLLGSSAESSETEILSFKKVDNSCFEALGFRKEESTQIVRALAEQEEEGHKNDKEIEDSKNSGNICAAKKLKMQEEIKKQIDLKKEQLTYLKNIRTDHTKANEMERAYEKYDPFGSITQLRLEAEYNFCRIEEGLQQELYKSGELEHAVQRKSCLREKIEGLTIIEGKIAALKEKFRNNKKEYTVAAKPLFQSYTQLLQKNRCN